MSDIFFKRTFKCFISVLFCLLFFETSAQQPKAKISADVKEVEAIQARVLDISGYDLDSAMLLAKQALQLSEKFKNDTCFAFAYTATGWCLYYEGNRDSAEYYLLKAINLYHKHKILPQEVNCLLNLSYVYQDGADYLKLMNCLKKARPLAEIINDPIVLANIDLTMGSTYGDMQQYEKGKYYIFSAIAITKQQNRNDMLTGCYSACGYIYMEEGKFDSALYYYRLNYALSTGLNDPESIAIASDNLGEAFQKKAIEKGCGTCIDSAYYYYKSALHFFTAMNSPGNIEYAKMNFGSVLRIKKEYKAAEKYLTDAFHYFDSTENIKSACSSAMQLSMLYEALGNYKQAYGYTIIANHLNDSLQQKKRTDSIAQMFAIYETEKRDRAIELLNAKAKLDKEKISQQYLIILFSVMSLVFIIVLAAVLINRSRIKQQLKEVKVRNQLAADLHDEVGSSLSSIFLLSKMTAKKNAEATDYNMLEKISGNTKEVIDKMADIVWMMNPKYDDGENVREKLEQYISRIKDIATFKIILEIDEAIDTIKFSMEIRKAILLISKEAVNNAVKYAGASHMLIQLKQIDKNLQLVITDDGIGFDTASVIKGNGLDTMALRAKNCKGNLDIQSSSGKGTKIKITLPIPRFRQKIAEI